MAYVHELVARVRFCFEIDGEFADGARAKALIGCGDVLGFQASGRIVLFLGQVDS